MRTWAKCMHYTNNLSTNQHLNKHDYDQLLNIHSLLDNKLNLYVG